MSERTRGKRAWRLATSPSVCLVVRTRPYSPRPSCSLRKIDSGEETAFPTPGSAGDATRGVFDGRAGWNSS